eukprot:4655097-Amphidinium_carterae.2
MLLPDDHWVSAWQIATNGGHRSLDAAERMLSRSWLLSAEDMSVPAAASESCDYVEVLLIALFWSGLPGTTVTSCLLGTQPALCSHRADIQIVELEGFGEA